MSKLIEEARSFLNEESERLNEEFIAAPKDLAKTVDKYMEDKFTFDHVLEGMYASLDDLASKFLGPKKIAADAIKTNTTEEKLKKQITDSMKQVLVNMAMNHVMGTYDINHIETDSKKSPEIKEPNDQLYKKIRKYAWDEDQEDMSTGDLNEAIEEITDDMVYEDAAEFIKKTGVDFDFKSNELDFYNAIAAHVASRMNDDNYVPEHWTEKLK